MEKEILKQKLEKMYWEQGKSLSVIAKQVGTSYGSIQRLFYSLGIIRRPFGTKGTHPRRDPMSDETKEKIAARHRGKKLSSEHRQKIASGLKEYRSIHPYPTLENHPNWKGGMIFQNGYVMIKRPDHPHVWANGYVKRAIVVAEEKIGRPMRDDEITHHVNHIKDDDRPENIQVMTNSEHASLHNDLKTKEILSRVEGALEKEG